MCFKQKPPKTPEFVPPPKEVDENAREAGNRQRQKALASQGMAGTIATSGQGVIGGANTAGKALLGA